jgi:hypothetical protein
MSVKADPTTAAQAWVTAMQGAGAKYTAGVQAVKVAPGQIAAARSDLWAQQVANAKQKFATNVAKVSLSQWQDAAANKGAQRLGTGATQAQQKMANFMSSFLPVLSSVVNSLPAGGTYEQNKQRFLAYADALHAKAGSF